MPEFIEHLPGHPSRSYKLLGILQSYAPTGSAQALCAELYRQAQADGLTELEVERYLIFLMTNGLDDDNWPWLVDTASPDSSTD